ncbi:putative immune-type receptor 14b isoform X1 [Silurus meridionalis]|nr:putative immune-type receptor 14b isoform X1 [Silurus meridionalis]
MYVVEPGTRRVSAQSLTDSSVYQPIKELSVKIRDSATLRCCISEMGFGDIAWFKQPNREKPQIIVNFFRTAGETFVNGFEKSKFIIKRSSARNCFNLTILNTTPSDEAVYYCALTYPSPEFGDGTYLTITDTVQPGKRWVSAQSLTESPVYQPDKKLSVDIGDSATLRCCFSKNKVETIDWFKQPKRQKPQIIVTVYKTSGETFYNESQKFNFRIEKSSTCIHLIILNTIQSDEAMYYCALMGINPVFADGTYLKISGR